MKNTGNEGKKNVPHGVRIWATNYVCFKPVTGHHVKGGTQNQILYSADPCPYLTDRSNPGVIQHMIGDENEALHVSLYNMHMRMQVSTGWRITAIQMVVNTCQYMTKLPARSTIRNSFALVAFSFFFFLLRSYRTEYDYAVFIWCFHSTSSQRLGRDPKPDPLFYSALLYVAVSPLFSSGILHTPCMHPTFTTQISPSPSSLIHQCWIMAF